LGQYPHDWERTAHTRDGSTYRIRPIRPDDAEREREFITGLSEDSRHSRMMNGMREPSAELVAYFVNVDYQRHMAFVALIGEGTHEQFIGITRYIVEFDEQCEFAIAVMDAWQSRGVGATLATLLIEYARAHGIPQFYCQMLATNQRMINFARWLGMSSHRHPNDASLIRAVRNL
jgi:acetyltransferase